MFGEGSPAREAGEKKPVLVKTEVVKEGEGDASLPPAKKFKEVRLRGIVFAMFTSTILAAANSYLGLFAGMTVSVSIPSAVFAIALLRGFGATRKEINSVQCGCSSGSSIAAGLIFTLPALLIMGTWSKIQWWEGSIIAGIGGCMGVFFSIPLRRALILEEKLAFPEGLATAEVIREAVPVREGEVEFEVDDFGENDERASQITSSGSLPSSSSGSPDALQNSATLPLVLISIGIVFGIACKLGQGALLLWAPTIEFGWFISGAAFAVMWSASPALFGVGYIVQLNVAILMISGSFINFLVIIPIIMWVQDTDTDGMDAAEAALSVWSEQSRCVGYAAPDLASANCELSGMPPFGVGLTRGSYVGVGAMLLGGVFTIIILVPSIYRGVKSGLAAFTSFSLSTLSAIPRLQRDIPIPVVFACLLMGVVPLFFVFWYFSRIWWVAIVCSVLMMIAGFVFSAVGAYMAGVVGSSNNPISGVTLATIITTGLLLLLMLGRKSDIGPGMTIMIGSVVCSAAALAGDNMQDLKAGHELGSTPWKLQIMQFIGLIFPSVLLPPIISLIIEAYGIGGVPTEEHPNPLPAPQAVLMAEVAEGLFFGDMPYAMMGYGAAIAAVVIILDLAFQFLKVNYRLHVLSVGLGLYLPMDVLLSVFLGACVSTVSGHVIVRWLRPEGTSTIMDESGDGEEKASTAKDDALDQILRNGVLLSAGMITGEACAGIAVSVPIVFTQRFDVLALFGVFDVEWPAVLVSIASLVLLALATFGPPLWDRYGSGASLSAA